MPNLGRFLVAGLWLAPCLVAERASAAPREVLSFTNVASWGEAGAPANVVAERSLVGGYSVPRLLVSATLEKLSPNTFASDARVFITPPGGQASLIVQPFAVDAFSGIVSISNLEVPVDPAWITTSGTWRIRFYEQVADASASPDAIWTSFSIALDDEPAPPPATLVPSNNVYTEVEGNSNRPRANRIAALEPGQVISGSTTGSFTLGEAIDSADYFQITTAPAPAGIYRHRAVLSSATPGHAMSLRGLTQSQGFIAPGSDATIQSATAATNPPRLCQWFGFGGPGRVVLRVAGLASTTSPYAIAYSREPVTPTDVGIFAPGTITISTLPATLADTDLWIYDENFTALDGFGNDDAGGPNPHGSSLSRDFRPGAYYIAISDYNLANHRASPPDDLVRSGPVMEFEGALANSSTAGGLSLSFQVQQAAPHVVSAFKPGPFEILFFRINVCPADLDDGTMSGARDGAVTIADLVYFLTAFEDGAIAADVDDGQARGYTDLAVTVDDLLYFLTRYEGGC